MNNVSLMGRITADLEVRQTNAGKDVLSFTIAVNENKDLTYFIDCVAWEKTALFISQYFSKGAMIGITGRLATRTYEDKDGKKRKAVDVIVTKADFCGGKTEKSNIDVPRPEEDDFKVIDDEGELPF